MDKKAYFKAYFEQATNCVKALKEALPCAVEILTAQEGDVEKQEAYFIAAQTFNTRLQQNPLAIVFCENMEHIKTTYQVATANQIPIRVRAGGHDHEGESSGTNVVLIDVSKMKSIELDEKTGIAKIGVGNLFECLVKELAHKNVMIAHGTCSSVSVTGFTFGGGWGPWTRKMGMNCEHLKGATIMLGDGSIIDVDEDENGNVPDLLWALRGGGGMSYGIVTELRLQTFQLPPQLIKFKLAWNGYDSKQDYPHNDFPTLNILKTWEKVIQANDTPQLIGTDLIIFPRPEVLNFDYRLISHNCIMYGFWEGTQEALESFVTEHFATVPTAISYPDGIPKTAKELYVNHSEKLMNDWDREAFASLLAKIQVKIQAKKDDLLKGEPILPFIYQPAAHKVTSRLVDHQGLGEEGYKQFLLSLTSPFIQAENRGLGLIAQVLLCAITGDYYRNYSKAESSAFPYKDKLYIMQYQVWWNKADENQEFPEPTQDGSIYEYVNRGLDWINAARDFDIPNTSGAFISFKDSSIPTSVYFDKNYDRLKWVKVTHSKDHYNHLRTRKTIM